MLRRHVGGLSEVGSKKNVVSIILVGNAFVWYYVVLSLLQSFVPEVLVWAPVHFSALIISALVGPSLAKKMERSRFLILWMIIGVVSSATLFGLANTSVIVVSLVSLFLGLSLGFGMPACMSYFTESVSVEIRGRVSGVIILASGMGIVAFGFAQLSDLLSISIVLGIWRFSSLVVFLWARDYRKIKRKESVSSFKRVFSQHSFILYFVPWVMFSLVNYLASFIPPNNQQYADLDIVRTVVMGASAVLGGIFADSVGRKRIAIASFAMLGLGAAVLGFLGNNLPQNADPILYFCAIMNGAAWGFLLVLFVLTLWGDISYNSSSEKYYALGVMPFFLSKLLELTLGSSIPQEFRSSSPLFSFTAFFLFLAILPLAYAPETLPEKTIKERELKIYIEKAQEIAQKYG